MGMQVASDIVRFSELGPLADWIQTFEIPESAVRYEIYDSTGRPRQYYVFEPFEGLSAEASMEEDPENIDHLLLGWTGSPESTSGRQAAWTLQVSTNGGATWETFSIVDHKGSVSVPPESFSSGGSRWFRVLCSDGFDSVTSNVAGPMVQTEPRDHPHFSIELPASGTVAPADAGWLFSAVYGNPDDAVVAVEWISSIDGSLGNGIELLPASLSAGSHMITALAVTASGLHLEDSVTIIVSDSASPDLSLLEAVLDLRADGYEPSFGGVRHPRPGSSTLSLEIPSPSAPGAVRVRMHAISPDGETLALADQTQPAGFLRPIMVTTRLATEQVGDWEIHASVEWADANPAESPYIDPDMGNNARIWRFTNDAPLARPGRLVLSTGQAAPLQLDAFDPDGDPVAYSVVSAPAFGELSGENGNFVYTAPDTPGTTTLAFAASDGIHPASHSVFEIVVRSSPPTINSPEIFSTTQFQDSQYQITATQSPTGYGALNLHLPAAPWQGLHLDPSNGLISGAPVRFGEDVLFVTASNPVGRCEFPLTVSVAESILRPQIQSSLIATGQAGKPFHHAFQVVNQPDTIRVDNLPEGLYFQAYSRTIRGEPSFSGSSTARIVASIGYGSGWLDLAIPVVLPPGGRFFQFRGVGRPTPGR